MFEPLLERGILNKLGKKLLDTRNKRNKEFESIADTFGDPVQLTKFYVEPLCQHHNPADSNEEEAIASVQSPATITIKTFLNGTLTKRDGAHQLFILSDAGMGKTSFLVMLKLSFLTSFWPQKLNCILLKLGESTLERIKNIKDKTQTLLLLDALDEDPCSYGRLEDRLVDLLNASSSFHRVIITCRTQYFPNTGQDPFDRPGRVDVENFLCPMIFLAYFNDEQIDEYLAVRFGRDLKKAAKAKSILDKIGSLRFRPLLLSYIDDLLELNDEKRDEFQLVYALVSTWVKRETRRLNKLHGKSLSSEDLWKICTEIALKMQENGRRTVDLEEMEQNSLASRSKQSIGLLEIGGRSLLNRNSDGNFRFSHYLLQEFLTALASTRGQLTKSPRVRATDEILRFIEARTSNAVVASGLRFEDMQISDSWLRNARLVNVEFKNVTLKGRGIFGLRLSNSKFNEIDLTDTEFHSVHMQNTEFDACNLVDSRFIDSSIDSCGFLNSALHRIEFRSTECQDINFNGSRMEPHDWSRMKNRITQKPPVYPVDIDTYEKLTIQLYHYCSLPRSRDSVRIDNTWFELSAPIHRAVFKSGIAILLTRIDHEKPCLRALSLHGRDLWINKDALETKRLESIDFHPEQPIDDLVRLTTENGGELFFSVLDGSLVGPENA